MPSSWKRGLRPAVTGWVLCRASSWVVGTGGTLVDRRDRYPATVLVTGGTGFVGSSLRSWWDQHEGPWKTRWLVRDREAALAQGVPGDQSAATVAPSPSALSSRAAGGRAAAALPSVAPATGEAPPCSRMSTAEREVKSLRDIGHNLSLSCHLRSEQTLV